MTEDVQRDLVLDPESHMFTTLPKGNIVVYSPLGNRKLCVLAEPAQSIYRLFEQGLSVAEVLKSSPISMESTQQVVKFLFDMGLLDDKPLSTASISSSEKEHSSKDLALWIHTTDVCNLRCDYCYVYQGKQQISREAWKAVLDAIQSDVLKYNIRRVRLKFAGGEPLVALKRIENMIAEAKVVLDSLGTALSLSIITNGTLLNESNVQTLKRLGFSTIMLSLDGLGKYNAARTFSNGQESVTKALQGLDYLLDAGIRPTVLTTVSNANIDGLGELSTFLQPKGVPHSLGFSREYAHGTGLALDVETIAEKMNVFLQNVITLSDEELPRLSFSGLRFSTTQKRICGGGKTFFAVDPKGNIAYCQMKVNQPFGNVAERHSIIDFADPIATWQIGGECSQCVWRHICCGGCSALADQAGTVGEPSVMCSLMRSTLPNIIAYMGRVLQKQNR